MGFVRYSFLICFFVLLVSPVMANECSKEDRLQWEALYRGYAVFYKVDTGATKLQTLFDWLLDPSHVCEGVVALAEDGGLAGLAQFRMMPSPLRGAEAGFLDDLFVDPARRGKGAGAAFLHHVDGIAAARGWPVTTWITRDANYRARGLYDSLSTRNGWIIYVMTTATTGRQS